MQITIHLFATLRDRAGFKSTQIELDDPATVQTLLDTLSENYPALEESLLNALVAVNQEYSFAEDDIHDGDEVALFPPVSGGSYAFPTYFAITKDKLDVDQIISHITEAETGGICVFTGAVRGRTTVDNGVLATDHLHYDSYVPMAEAKLHQVAEEIWQRYPLVRGVAVVQRIGTLKVGETTVLVACAAGHRDQGIFEAARYGIDRLKEIVPVWKKEVRPDGTEWVEGHYHPTPQDVLAKKSKAATDTPRFGCASCGESYPIDTDLYRCKCGEPFVLIEHQAFSRTLIDTSITSMWRYHRKLLPDGVTSISLGEGWTPLITLEVKNRKIYLKMESMNPTGSFKDRGAAMLVSMLNSQGKTHIHDDSSGNAGVALAAYSARAGFSAQLFVPAYASPVKLAQISIYGATLSPIEGPRSAATVASQKTADSGESTYASHIYHPFAVLGYRTIAYEIWEQLGFRVPDIMIIPLGHGSQILGVGDGFNDLLEAGLIKKRPRLIGVQPEACAPLWQQWNNSYDNLREGKTLAEGIRIIQPIRGKEVIEHIRQSDGDILTVTEDEIVTSLVELSRRGISAEPTSAVVWAALNQIIDQLPEDSVTIAPITGSGYKTPNLAEILSSANH